MVQQPKWDQYEIVLLIEACEKVNNGLISKQNAVKELSAALRERAVAQGKIIDEIFRNENGISLQMTKMNYLLSDGAIGLPGASKLYADIVALKKDNLLKFDAILRDAHTQTKKLNGGNDLSTNKQGFVEWLNKQVKLKSSPNSIILALDDASEYAMKHGITKVAFWNIYDAKQFDSSCRKLLGMRIFRVVHKKTAQFLDKTYLLYKDYLQFVQEEKSKENDVPAADLKPAERDEESSGQPFVCTTPEEEISRYSKWLTSIAGMPSTTVSSYTSSLRTIALFAIENGILGNSILLASDEEVIDNITTILDSTVFAAYNAEQHNRFSASLKKYAAFRVGENNLPESFSRRKNHSVDLQEKLHAISKVYDDPQGLLIGRIVQMLGPEYPVDEVRTCLEKMDSVTKIDDETYSFSKHPAIRSQKPEPNDFDKDKYVKVLLTRFGGGLQFDSIDLDNFRDTYDNLYDETIGFSDNELIERLKLCGLFFEGRLFAAEGIIDDSAKGKLFAYIENSFNSGNKVLYYNSIYSDLEHVFEYCFSLTGVLMLKAFIEYTAEPNMYYFFDNFMSTERNVKIDHSKEIADFMLAAGKPMPDKEVYAGLSHISDDIIYKEIRFNPCYQRNEKECYFHIGIFEFSSEDGEKISDLINHEIDENGYAIWSSVFSEIQEQMPIFLENNLYLSSLGLRNALSQRMSDKFDFLSEVISLPGENLSMGDVYRLYAKHHAPFSDKDIYEFSKKIGSIIYFWSVAEEAVRVSDKLFVPKDQLSFDIAATDKALETYLSSGYMFVKDVDSFLVFPNVGYEWNKYLLESYLLHYSEKFALINNGSSLNNVAGAIVKKDGRYTEFVDICADALANSGTELKKAPALDYLAEVNLITRRSYKELDVALTKARQIRNRKG